MQDYKKLKVWEKGHELVLLIYDATRAFPKEELYGLTSQLRRAAASIPANIAEGAGRNSKADFANFLNISLGSANETEYFLLLAKDLEFITSDTFSKLSLLVNEIKAMLISLVSTVRQ